MKKLLMTAFAAGLSMLVCAQDLTFKPFKVDIATGYALTTGMGEKKGGYLISLEPKYALSDYLTLGVRSEIETDEASDRMSFLATADYYFNTNNFRPFLGAGAGLFRTDIFQNNTFTNTFGFMPRIGVEFGHRRLSVEYNVGGKVRNAKNSYVGFKFGYFFGGGRYE